MGDETTETPSGDAGDVATTVAGTAKGAAGLVMFDSYYMCMASGIGTIIWTSYIIPLLTRLANSAFFGD